MKRTKTLAIMAAGFGSRFGGLKQLEHITESGYSIIDFSIFDAIEAGFNSIIFIVREEILNDFKTKYEHTLPDAVTVDFVVQRTDAIPEQFLPTSRKKPWGTGQAMLSLKDKIQDNFILINADDFYGKEAFKIIHDHLYGPHFKEDLLVSYQLENTLSENGTVSRGQCFLDENRYLTAIVERTKITKQANKLINLDPDNKMELPKNTEVSMNFWGFSPNILKFAEYLFTSFLEKNHESEKAEFYIPSVVDYALKNNLTTFKALPTTSKWYGITYREDHKTIVDFITNLIEKGLYPKTLW